MKRIFEEMTKSPDTEALGLRGLSERTRAVRGQMDISSARGRTTMMLWVPLEAGA